MGSSIEEGCLDGFMNHVNTFQSVKSEKNRSY